MQVEPHAFKAKMTSNLNTQPSHVCRKMGKAYLEHSIAELESQLRQVRMQNPPGPVGGRPCLLDISTLIYALPVVKKWARGDDYAELLLPVDGQSIAVFCSLIPCQEDLQLNI